MSYIDVFVPLVAVPVMAGVSMRICKMQSPASETRPETTSQYALPVVAEEIVIGNTTGEPSGFVPVRISVLPVKLTATPPDIFALN